MLIHFRGSMTKGLFKGVLTKEFLTRLVNEEENGIKEWDTQSS